LHHQRKKVIDISGNPMIFEISIPSGILLTSDFFLVVNFDRRPALWALFGEEKRTVVHVCFFLVDFRLSDN
jgi:hypothetical protein